MNGTILQFSNHHWSCNSNHLCSRYPQRTCSGHPSHNSRCSYHTCSGHPTCSCNCNRCLLHSSHYPSCNACSTAIILALAAHAHHTAAIVFTLTAVILALTAVVLTLTAGAHLMAAVALFTLSAGGRLTAPSPFSHLQQALLWNSQQPSFPPPPPLLKQQMPMHTGSEPQSFLQLLNSSDLETFANMDTSGHASAGLEPPQFLSSDYPQLSDFDAINCYSEDDKELRCSSPGVTEPLEEDDGLYLEADTTIQSSDQPQHFFTPRQFFSGLLPDHPTSNHPDLMMDTTTVQADVTELNCCLSTLVHKVSC